MELTELNKLGIEVLGNIILQIIIVASGLLTFTVTFSDKLQSFGKKVSKPLLLISWFFLVVSIVIGFFSLFRFAGALLKTKLEPVNEYVIDSQVLNLTGVHFAIFSFAIIAIFAFAVISTVGAFQYKGKSSISKVP